MGLLKDRLKQFFDYEKGMSDLKAYARQGLAEVRSLFYAESPHARMTDPGMYGNALPMEVYRDRHGEPGRTVDLAKPDDSLSKLQKEFEPQAPSPKDDPKEDKGLDKE